MLFVGLHRSWRDTTVSRFMVHGLVGVSRYGGVLKSDALPGFLSHVGPVNYLQQFGNRSASGTDDAQVFVKVSLVKLHDCNAKLVTQAYSAQSRTVARDSAPDLLEPFAELVRALLPHLEWVGVDEDNEQDIRCLFRPVDQPEQRFDVDELSSGEKAEVALLLPLVEGRAEQSVTPTDVAPAAWSL